MRNRISAMIFLIFILLFGVGFWVFPDREFSDLENRNLTMRPEFSVASLMSGEFTSTFESYMSDQLPGKDLFVQGKVDGMRLMGQKLQNGVFFGRDGYMIQQFTQPTDQLQKNLDAIKTFAQSISQPVTMLIAPNASEIYADKLPAMTTCYSQKKVIGQVVSQLSDCMMIADPTELLAAHKEEEIYFRTDHHWTARGAYYGYQSLCEALQIEADPLSDYQEHQVSDAFYGSLYSKAPSIRVKPDTLTLYERPDGVYSVKYVQENETSDSLYVMDNLKKKDKYTVFLGGNHPYITIDSNAKSDERVLVVKDSYAHDLLPYLADTYAHLYVVDLRYFHQDIHTFMEENKIDRVIMIHNVDFLSTDVNFLWLN